MGRRKHYDLRPVGQDKVANGWCALDPKAKHPLCDGPTNDFTQEATQQNKMFQLSDELIVIKDSCDVNVTTTDTKAAVNLQAALQAALVILISLAVGDSPQTETIAQELLQTSRTKQLSFQKVIVGNSRNVDVQTTDTQAVINIQILLQLLIVLAIRLDIL
ncbi:spore coat protein [Halalkalibacterium halodurans]|uniref:Spore coat protein X (Insoluble fraction) n=1 Tax=Halalkalibacterium halodurans (strain ATCC BAA-125 / DSM 18197 / FERM 7344 / JCM 9153 / C-125) TaxID=272558 RepID=Q9KAU4_HALH5|nr:spore coat protein [Halalkalibacterium halodurans]MED3646958.1 spore coat protein [Halalkalibacterium halodurans]MED4123664.1 spore coat protein [Halalkalibacterium halodurans]MED4173680.1 spore coat protein [Halalkalibacterium halodurans]BAB05911.1 spore coat protein X (insoluble fraction) [Halalkalibacterium halodurans C-125]